MKKIITCLLVSSALFISCKKETSQTKETSTQETEKQITYSIDSNASEVHWTAYKTTAKKAVKGVFTKLNLTNAVNSTTKQGVFENLEFNIPITSFFSKDETRDTKIKALFFGIMDNTSLIKGTFSNVTGNETKGTMTLNLTMNNETVGIPMTYSVDKNIISINGNIVNLMDWKLEKAFNSLHKACELLHTGEDGVSKTWKEVAINAIVVLK
ncbi:MAG: YceI family protein [Flavobacteriaceae bacterium]